jgi:hypothetical protein
VLQVAGKTHSIEGKNYLPVKQWVDNGVVHTLAEPGTPDWLEARTKKFFDNRPESGDVGKVLRTIKSYKVGWIAPVNQGSTSYGEAIPTRGGQGTVTFNPYNDSDMRLNTNTGSTIYCVRGARRSHFNTILHEARHCYQGFIATMENDADGDQLVKNVPIEPKTIIVDSTEQREVWETGNVCHMVAYKGDATFDEYETADHKGVKNAIEKDAAEFAKKHDE